jgi:hypothetical protein
MHLLTRSSGEADIRNLLQNAVRCAHELIEPGQR